MFLYAWLGQVRVARSKILQEEVSGPACWQLYCASGLLFPPVSPSLSLTPDGKMFAESCHYREGRWDAQDASLDFLVGITFILLFYVFFLGRVGEYDLLVIRVVCDIFYLICAFVISSHYVLICNSDFDKSLFLLLNSFHNLLIWFHMRDFMFSNIWMP